MHPILASGRRLLLYLAAWLPLGGLLAYLLAAAAQLRAATAVALAAPLTLFYAFLCLSAWYSCRVLPLASTPPARIAGAHFVTAIMAGGLWAALANLLRAPTLGLGLIWGTGILLYWLAVAGFYLIIGLDAARRAEALAREAELRALKAQINPHFLFNSLNSISALTATDAARARQMCVLLGDFLRRTLGLSSKPSIPLTDELALVQAYLEVEQVRFGDRLHFDLAVDPATRSALLPPLLLQPLIENAVVHGIATLVAGGTIQLSVISMGQRLEISVANPFDPDAPRRPPSGLGLANVRARMLARYGAAAAFNTASADGCFTAHLALPWEAET